MNKYINKKEEEPKPKAVSASKGRKSVFAAFEGVFDSSFLNDGFVRKHLVFSVFLAFLIALYIANAYRAEKTIRQINRMNTELIDMRSEYTTLLSELMYKSNQSQVAMVTARQGLLEAKTPPKKIFLPNPKNHSGK